MDTQDQELFDLAARLMGQPATDLLQVVRRADGSLVVILGTGQKYVFDPAAIAAQLGRQLQDQLAAAAPTALEPKPRTARRQV